jgi:MFS family permease
MIHGKLDKETFVRAIVLRHEKRRQANGIDDFSLPNFRDVFYFCNIALFSMGGVFALFAVATMSERFKVRMDIDESQIGLLNTSYFVAAMIGPFIGGYIMDNFAGPATVAAGGNTIVTIGALVQWLANTPDSYGLLLFGRFLIGFGLESVFTTVQESLGRVFPKQYGLMAGVADSLDNIWTFIAFQVLSPLADSRSDTDLDSSGTDFALMVCFLLCLASTIASYAVAAGLFLEERSKKDEENHTDEAVLVRTFGAYAKAAIPTPPKGFASFKLPVSLYLTIFGCQAIGYHFNTFLLYSVEIYRRQFGLSESAASFVTGASVLISVPLSPILGALTDKIGSRAKICAFATLLGLGAVLILLGSDGIVGVWVATVLFALMSSTYGISTFFRLIVGTARAGLGWGVFSILGNGIGALNAYIGGALIASGDNGDIAFLWYSAAFIFVGFLCFVAVYRLERDMSFLERPVSQMIETELKSLHYASICSVVVDPPDDDDSCKKKEESEYSC